MKKIFGILFCGCVVFSLSSNAQSLDKEYVAKFGDQQKAAEFLVTTEKGVNQYIDQMLKMGKNILVKKQFYTEDSAEKYMIELEKRIDKKSIYQQSLPCIMKNTKVSKSGCRTGASSNFSPCVAEQVVKIENQIEYMLIKDTVRENEHKQKQEEIKKKNEEIKKKNQEILRQRQLEREKKKKTATKKQQKQQSKKTNQVKRKKS